VLGEQSPSVASVASVGDDDGWASAGQWAGDGGPHTLGGMGEMIRGVGWAGLRVRLGFSPKLVWK
jgi:hypothetical protein